MANNLEMNPMFIDTAVAIFPASKQVSLKAVAWLADQVAGKDIAIDDDLLISDANGGRIIGKRASSIGDGLEMYHFPEGYYCDGLTVTTIDGGVLYLFF